MHWFLDPITKHYADFSGRATRQQYCMFVLLSFIIGFALGIVLGIIKLSALIIILQLAIIVPSIAIGVRRLHDMGHSGWVLLAALVPIVNLILFIFLLVTKGEETENKYGPSPYGEVTDGDVPPAPAAPVAPVADAPAPEAVNEVEDEPAASAPEGEENKQEGYGN